MATSEIFIAFFNRDYRKVAELHVDSGWVPPDTNVEDFEFAIRTVCEPIFEKPLAEISFGHVLLNLFNTARRFNMEVFQKSARRLCESQTRNLLRWYRAAPSLSQRATPRP